MKKQYTERGFGIYNFKDKYKVECSIQKSSAASEDCIWLGANDIGLKHFKAYEGWKDVDLINTIEEHYVANNRMHLTRKQVEKLLPILEKFVKTGEI